MGPLFLELDAEKEASDTRYGQHSAYLVLAFVEHIILRNIKAASPIEAVENTHHDEPQGVKIADVGPRFQVAVQGDSDAHTKESNHQLGKVGRPEPMACEMEDDKFGKNDDNGKGKQPHKTG